MRLIDVDELLNDLIFPTKQFEKAFTELINDAPTVDAEPTLSELAQCCEKRGLVLVESAVFKKMKSRCSTESVKHGRWINQNGRWHCSECGMKGYKYPYCPYCGADMRGGENG